MQISDLPFQEVWAEDFEFSAPPGEKPTPVCYVAREVRSGRVVRLIGDELTRVKAAPHRTDADVLAIAYYGSAEGACYVVLGWPLPVHVLDLFAEFRCRTNGCPVPNGNSLLGALTFFGLPAIEIAAKDEFRALALRGAPYTLGESEALLAYCQSDVDGVVRLLPHVLQDMDVADLGRALLRGRYMQAAARIELTGVPVDVTGLGALRENWTQVQEEVIRAVDAQYHIFEGRTFSSSRWRGWLAANGVPWPTTPAGQLALDDDTFREMARAFPSVAPIHELRATLSKLRLNALEVGRDGRNRCLLSAFRARTGRNQPSNSKFIFGPAVWIRGLIRPEAGTAIAYVDWCQQEFGIAAALSQDAAMLKAYRSGDPYLALAQQAGLAPATATRTTHARERELAKACALAVQYGMGERSLGQRLGQSTAHARELLARHRYTYRQFWRWSDAVIDFAALNGFLHTVFGWRLRVADAFNDRSLRNFPMQANGAEMLRLACSFMTEAGIRVCAPVHDAVLIEAPSNEIEVVAGLAQKEMARASACVLGGLELRSEVKIVRYPDRYGDERGRVMWETVWNVLARASRCGVAAKV